MPITNLRCTLIVLCVLLGGFAEYFQIILALYVLDIRRKLLHSALDGIVAFCTREVECVIKTYSVAEVFIYSASIILGKEKMGFTTSFYLKAVNSFCSGGAVDCCYHFNILVSLNLEKGREITVSIIYKI